MLKKFIFLISFSFLIILNLNYLEANESILVPLKKPILTDQELKRKVLINIIKPLAKPNKVIKEKKIKKIVKKELTKPIFLIPKKKPSIVGINKETKITKTKKINQNSIVKKIFLLLKKL